VEPVLLIDIGSTYTKVAAVNIKGQYIIGAAQSFTTVETDITEGLFNALGMLRKVTGTNKYCEKYACSSAAGGLKMIAAGLVPELTAKAAKMAALSAGAKVLKTYSYELSDKEAGEIYSLRPDIVLLSGGTDGGNKTAVLNNAKKIASIKCDFPVVIACNKTAADDAAAILSSGGKDVRVCENVMPEFNVLNILPAQELIRRIFLERITKAKGLTRVQEMTGDILMPTPAAVLKAAVLLSKGTKSEKGFNDLLVVDVGGATTDVYSITDGSPQISAAILKGIPEPYEKRTVEGDLGVRHSAVSLAEAAGIDEIAARSCISSEEACRLIDMISKKPDLLASDDKEIGRIDNALASLAVKLAVERHAGRLSTAFTISGEVFIQTGKDLGSVETIIGTGGSVINGKNPEAILSEALRDKNHPEVLKPVKAKIMLDRKYILSSMGLLSVKYPEIALTIMKKELEMIQWN
jgi:uncharacterized protein (TIGR01319 family)